MKDLLRILSEKLESHQPLSLVTVVDVSGSAPQRTGAKMLVSKEGKRLWGTVGGGTIEKIALEQAYIQIKDNKPLLRKYELHEVGEDSTGMLCGGTMTLFFDVMGSLTKAYVFGAGHISQKLIPIMSTLGFWTIVIDDRKEYLYEHFKESKANELLPGKLPEIIDSIEFQPNSFVIVMTYSHSVDEEIVQYLITKKEEKVKQLKYFGMIGSKRKVREIFKRLGSRGVNKELLETIHAPIGIDIGSQTPEEIAISIAAELVKVRNS